jgi:hypothetical protein
MSYKMTRSDTRFKHVECQQHLTGFEKCRQRWYQNQSSFEICFTCPERCDVGDIWRHYVSRSMFGISILCRSVTWELPQNLLAPKIVKCSLCSANRSSLVFHRLCLFPSELWEELDKIMFDKDIRSWLQEIRKMFSRIKVTSFYIFVTFLNTSFIP